MLRKFRSVCGVAALLGMTGVAQAVPVTFTNIGDFNVSGSSGTTIFRASLGGLGIANLVSLQITDGGSVAGGRPGIFSGFDLDAVRLSYTLCNTAACAAAAPSLSVFDFINGISFTPGAMAPVGADAAAAGPRVFGSSPGNVVNNAVATLGAFDAVYPSGAEQGWVTLGLGGSIAFNLTSAISTEGLYLYIGEVGNNGEVAAGNVQIRDTPVKVPEPAALGLLGLGLLGAAVGRHKRR
jgi:PEP-CTERM motif